MRTTNVACVLALAILTSTAVATGASAPHLSHCKVTQVAVGSGSFNLPTNIVVAPDGNYYIANRDNHNIIKITTPGLTESTFAGGGNYACDVVWDVLGGTFVWSDTNHCVIKKVTAVGSVTTFSGISGTCVHADGNSASATYNNVCTIVIEPRTGNYFVGTASAIRYVTTARDVTTLAGGPTIGQADSTTAGSVRFNGVRAMIFIDDDDVANTYLVSSDESNHAIRKTFVSTGATSTLAGQLGTSGGIDGISTTARFNQPRAMVRFEGQSARLRRMWATPRKTS